jgi:Fe-S-cluster-containing dehydrogenase component/DMSO reductase anchor subunit
MNEGFIFNHNRCVGCGACSAACMLENSWTFQPRTIYSYNSEALPSIPVINLSLACNHCATALCMDGCPSNAYHRDAETGAVIIDDSQCLGCRYCQWNCPYDAPKYILREQVIGKCHLCQQRLREGLMPACAAACPTGALKYGKFSGHDAAAVIPWFPDKNLEPAVRLTGNSYAAPNIIPQSAFDSLSGKSHENSPQPLPEWSLVGFSFLTTLSVAQIVTALISGHFPSLVLLFLITSLAGIASLFHLGKKRRAWKAVKNIRSSPLSREIGLFILFSILAATAGMLQLPLFLVLSSVAGLILLLSIDAVYFFSDKRKTVFLHSGQAFISGLLMISFMTGKILPFIFIAALSLASSVWHIRLRDNNSLLTVIRFMRIALLIITGMSVVTGISYHETAVICLFLAGELLNRILFYFDFKPLNINRLNENLINKIKNEKERS